MNLKKLSFACCSLLCSKDAIRPVFFLILILMISCTSALYIPTERQQTSTASLLQLQTGREYYIQKCASCHALYLPEKFSKAEWQYWVDKMQLKVALDSTEKENILLYLTKGL